jgi:hypothetical protein
MADIVESYVYINGEFCPKAEARIPVFDRGFLYGDGVFEGIRVYGGKVFRLEQHLRRLYRGAKAIMLEIPLTPRELQEVVIEAVRRNGMADAYIRLVVSRGCGDLGLDPRNCHTPATVVVIVDRLALYPREVYETGLEVITCFTRRNLPSALNPEVKSPPTTSSPHRSGEGKPTKADAEPSWVRAIRQGQCRAGETVSSPSGAHGYTEDHPEVGVRARGGGGGIDRV